MPCGLPVGGDRFKKPWFYRLTGRVCQVIFETGRLTEDLLISALGGLDHMERLLCELWHWRHHEVCDPMRCLLLQNVFVERKLI